MFRLKNQLSHGRFFSISVVAVFVAAYAVYGLWLGTKPAIPDHAIIVGGLVIYVGLLVIALLAVWRVVRFLQQR